MLKLGSSSSSSDPIWLDLVPGVRVQVRPITIAARLLARNAGGNVYRGRDPAEQVTEELRTQATMALTRSLVHQGLVAWEGVGDADGNTVDVTPENIDALLDVWVAYDAFDRLYVNPAFAQEAEKNG